MPLLELKTNLKSLKYSDSGTDNPLVTKDINNPPNGSGLALEANRRIDDLQRITKFLVSRDGLKFAGKQALLGNGPGQILKIAGSALAQVPVNGTGTHFVYAFGNKTYLENRSGPKSALGAFIQNNLGIGGGVQGAKQVLKGKPVIEDNYGGEGYRSPGGDRLQTLNSRFDLKSGFDNDFDIPTSYLRDDLQNAFNFVKGLFGSKKNAVILPDNNGTEGFRTPQKNAIEYSSNYELGSEATRYTGQDGKLNSSVNSVETSLNEQQTEVDIASAYTGQDGRTNTGVSQVSSSVETQQTEVDTATSYTGQDGRVNAATSAVTSSLARRDDIPDRPADTIRGGKQLGSLGSDYDATAEGYVIVTEDENGGITGTQGESVSAGKVPQTGLRSFQDSYSSDESFDIKTGAVSGADGKGSRVRKIIDFRKVRKDSKTALENNIAKYEDENGFDSKTDITGIDYTTQQIDVRLGMAGVDKTLNPSAQSDKINMIDDISVDPIANGSVEDMIPFQFISVTPEKNYYLTFRAFLESFNDNYSGDWSGTKFIGRAEEFFTYQGFKRDISFAFKIAAFSKEELMPLYAKLNYLVGTTAPTYGAGGQFMRGTLTQITLGDYLFEQTGFISKVSLSWDKGYPWEIDGSEIKRLPHVMNVDVSFTPIQHFNVKQDLNIQTEAYIGNA